MPKEQSPRISFSDRFFDYVSAKLGVNEYVRYKGGGRPMMVSWDEVMKRGDVEDTLMEQATEVLAVGLEHGAMKP